MCPEGVGGTEPRTGVMYWCPRCKVQSERLFHFCEKGPALFPQMDNETQCEVVRVVEQQPPTEERATFSKPPRDWWRDVPCGHPQDPVAWWGEHGPFCHCGRGLDLGDALPERPHGAPGPIVPCGKCGCFPAIPPKPLPPGPPADYPERLDKALRAGDIHEVRRLRARRNLANEGANPSERPETWDPATVDAVVRELESEDDVTVNVKLTSGPKFRAGWDAAVAHIRARFKGAARDTGGRDDG